MLTTVSVTVWMTRYGGEKMKGLRDEGFGRIIRVSGEVAKNVDYSCGKAGNEQEKRS